LKKIILFVLLATSLYSDAKIYFGLGVSQHNENLISTNNSSLSNMVSLKVGYGKLTAYSIEFSLDYIDNKSKIFADADGFKYGMNISLIKSFDVKQFFIPYIKVGMGAGEFESTAPNSSKKYLEYGSFNLGIGAYIPLSESFDFEISYDYRNVTYEKAVTTQNIEKSNVNVLYTGINFKF